MRSEVIFLNEKKITAGEVIAVVDGLKPNAYGIEDKIRWLDDINGQIMKRVHKLQYKAVTGQTDELYVSVPFDSIYRYYLFAMIDFHNEETELYVNDWAMFQSTLKEYENQFTEGGQIKNYW